MNYPTTAKRNSTLPQSEIGRGGYKRAYIAAFERGFEKAAREGHPNVLAMLGMGGEGCVDAYELKQVASGIAERYGERRFARWLDDRPLDDEDKKYIKDVLT